MEKIKVKNWRRGRADCKGGDEEMSRNLWFEDKTGDDIDFYSETDSDNVIYNLHEDCLAMKEEINELKAHIERLREAMHYVLQAWNYEGVDMEHGSIFKEAETRLDETPSQSLNHLLAQVEEETIERYENWADFANGWNCGGGFPRKYKEQSEEGGE